MAMNAVELSQQRIEQPLKKHSNFIAFYAGFYTTKPLSERN